MIKRPARIHHLGLKTHKKPRRSRSGVFWFFGKEFAG